MSDPAEIPSSAPENPATETSEKSIKKLVPIVRIIKDHTLQVRCGLNEQHVENLLEMLKEHGHLDPVKLYFENDYLTDPLLLSAGFHRVETYLRDGRTEIPAILVKGNKSEALAAAIRENSRHGLMMTNADKRRAAELAVLDSVLGEYPDAKIAKRIGCSASLVAEVRRGETKEQAKGKRKESSRNPKNKPEAGSSAGASPAPSTSSAAGPALQPVNAHERKPNDTRPTKAAVLRQMEQYVDSDVVDEQDVIKLFESKLGEYVWVPKMGAKTKLKVVGKSGRAQVEVDVLVKDVTFEAIVLKNEGDPLQVSS